MAYQYIIDHDVNCVFVQHHNRYDQNDGHNQIKDLLADPAYKVGMNILKDVRTTSYPKKFDFEFFKTTRPSKMFSLEEQLGKCKIGILVGSAKDFATAHQLEVSTRLDKLKVQRKPFRKLAKARAWLGIPENYQIIFPQLVE